MVTRAAADKKKAAASPGAVVARKPRVPKATDAALAKFEETFAKNFGADVIRREGRVEKYDVISTGSIELDYAMGSGGWVMGRMSENWGPDGTGKGHPLDHPVLTPDGWRRIGDLVEGDFVVGRDGLPTEVTAIYDRGELDVFTVTFNDGAQVVCDGDHLWTVRASKGWVTYDTRTLLTEKQLQTPEGWNRYQIPLVDAVQHPELGLPIDPYLLGTLLANGYLDGTPVIRTNDEFVCQTVFDRASQLGETVKDSTSDTSTAQGIAVHGIRDRLRFLGLYGTRSATKFIPEQYLRASEYQRVELLSALLDCDGSSGAKTRYHTTSRRLAEGVVELVRSLGGVARPYELERQHDDGRSYTEFSVGILVSECPFTTPAKVEIWKPPTKLSRRMVSIEPAGRAEVRCIRVAADDHLYVTKDHVVTHNTTLALIGVAMAQLAYPDRMTTFIDMENKLDRGWAVKNGVDLKRMYHVVPPSAEDLADIVKAMLQSKLVSFIALDSVGAMVNEEEIEKDADERSVGTTPGIITRMVKVAASLLPAANCHLHIINQVRANLAYGADTTTGGGFALKHATVHRLKSRRAMGKPIQVGSGNDAVTVGFQTAFKVEKNQVASPGRTAIVTFVNQPTEKYGMTYGVADRPGEAFSVGKKTGIIARTGGAYVLPDGSTAKSEDACRALLAGNPDLVEEIRRQVVDFIASGDAATTPPVVDEDEQPDPRDPDSVDPADVPEQDEGDMINIDTAPAVVDGSVVEETAAIEGMDV